MSLGSSRSPLGSGHRERRQKEASHLGRSYFLPLKSPIGLKRLEGEIVRMRKRRMELKPSTEGSKMVKLTSGVMPPSNVGRKPKPLDSELVEALHEALSNALPEEVETESFETKLYPAFFGPDFSEKKHSFAKDHQAQAEGRKYAGPVSKRIGKVVRVNVYDNGVLSADGKPVDGTRYAWRLYVPVSEYTEEELAAANAEDEGLPPEGERPEGTPEAPAAAPAPPEEPKTKKE